MTSSLFGLALNITELRYGIFPLLTSRRIYYKGVFGELAAMLAGPKHVNTFKKHGCNYWDQWANEDGSINVDYGNAWLDWDGYNQIEETIKSLTENPYGRRHVISGWRPDKLSELSLPCCHMLYQFYVGGDNTLSMMWYQRSADMMVGVPSDVVFAAAWLLDMCRLTGYKPGDIKMVFTDAHIYRPHFDKAHDYVERIKGRAPTYAINHGPRTSRYFRETDVDIIDYEPHTEPMKFEVFS